MSKYLFIESRDPFESNDVTQSYGLAKELAQNGSEVAFFLVQNGVFASRNEADVRLFQELTKEANVKVYADDLSLAERGITAENLHKNIKQASSDELVDLLMESDRKPIWH